MQGVHPGSSENSAVDLASNSSSGQTLEASSGSQSLLPTSDPTYLQGVITNALDELMGSQPAVAKTTTAATTTGRRGRKPANGHTAKYVRFYASTHARTHEQTCRHACA